MAIPPMATAQPSSERRPSQSALVNGLRRSIAGSPVVGDEEFLEIGLLTEQVDHGVPGGGLDQRVGPAAEPAVQRRVDHGDVTDPGQVGEFLRRYRCLEVDL